MKKLRRCVDCIIAQTNIVREASECCLFRNLFIIYNKAIVFHVIMDESVTDRQRQALERVVEDCDLHHVVFHLVDGKFFDEFPQLGTTKAYITKATYYRLLFTDIFGAEIHKLLYLDGDMIITGSLRELWETDLDGYAVGAVTDMPEGIHDYHRLGCPASLGYCQRLFKRYYERTVSHPYCFLMIVSLFFLTRKRRWLFPGLRID